MVRVKATIQVNGKPLRRAYVEHIVLGAGTNMYMTDLDGKIRDEHFDEGIDSLTPNADIRIICQNPALRVLDGNLGNIGVYQDKSITNGQAINLNTVTEQVDHYAILNRAELAYELVFHPLSFFRSLSDPDFPLGRNRQSLRVTRDQAKRIDLSYPDNFVSPLTFVEPKRLGDNFPLMHIKSHTSEPGIFGEHGFAPTIIPGELAHALHFSFLNEAQRQRAQDKYLEFILSSPISGVGPTHNFTVRTTPEVAYIEAADWFSQNFMEFLRARQGGASTLVHPEPITPAIQAEFVATEWQRRTKSILPPLRNIGVLSPVTGTGTATSSSAVAAILRQTSRLLRRPTVIGGDVEGAVYSAIFVDFAGLVGLDFAASAYFEANALTFGEYRDFINRRHPAHAPTLETVRRFWGL